MSAIVLDLKKKFELNLEKAGILNVPILQARLAIDKSGSMSDLFKNGWVSNAIDLFIGAALKFDDNGELEVGFFNSDFDPAPMAYDKDVGVYLKTKGKAHFANGGTNFAPIISNFENPHEKTKKPGLISRLFGGRAAPVEQFRAYVGVITDGENSDALEFRNALDGTDGNTFYQFIGIGNQVNKTYLMAAAAKFPHLSFVHIEDPTKMTPDDFYAALCNPKFADWI
jgi:hypothetical protein